MRSIYSRNVTFSCAPGGQNESQQSEPREAKGCGFKIFTSAFNAKIFESRTFESRFVRTSKPRLADFLCFAVYSANLAYGRAYKAILEELGLTYTQYIAIVALWEEDNQTVSSLGEKLFLESNTLTPILKKLETMGYLRRQRDAADERQVLVSLTDAGRRLRRKGCR